MTWTRKNITIGDGRNLDVYQATVKGLVVSIEARLVDLMEPPQARAFMEGELDKALANRTPGPWLYGDPPPPPKDSTP